METETAVAVEKKETAAVVKEMAAVVILTVAKEMAEVVKVVEEYYIGPRCLSRSQFVVSIALHSIGYQHARMSVRICSTGCSTCLCRRSPRRCKSLCTVEARIRHIVRRTERSPWGTRQQRAVRRLGGERRRGARSEMRQRTGPDWA